MRVPGFDGLFGNGASVLTGIGALTCMVYFAVTLAVLHLTRTEFDPVVETVSQYAIGPQNYLLISGFFVMGAGFILHALGLFFSMNPAPSIGTGLLALSGVAILFGSNFPVDRSSGAMPISEVVHNSAFIGSLCVAVAAMFVLTAGFRMDRRWRAVAPVSLAIAFCALTAVVLFFVTYNTSFRGLVQRVCITTVFSWLAMAAVVLIAVESREGAARPYICSRGDPSTSSG